MRGAAAILLASASLACVDRRVIDVPLDGYAFEYGFVVLLDEAGDATRVSPPFGVADGALTLGTLPAYELEPDEKEMILVGLPEGSVRGAVSLFDETRAAQMELAVSGPTELPFYVDDAGSGEHLFVELPESAQVLRGDFERALAGDVAPEPFALRVPIAPEQCSRFDPAGLEPFGTEANIVSNGDGAQDNFLLVELVDGQTAVALAPNVMYLFRAGEPFTPRLVTASTPGNQLGRESLPPNTGYAFGGYAIDRGDARLWVAAAISDGTDRTDGVLMELSVDTSALAIVSTSTAAGLYFQAVALDPEQRPMLLGVNGEFLRYEGAGVFTEMPSIADFAPEELMLRLHATGDPTFPYLASSDGRLHVYLADEARWSSESIPSSWLRTFPLDTTYRGTGLASRRAPDGQLELWAAGTSGVVVRKIGDRPWENIDIAIPPRFAPCSRSSAPYPHLSATGGFDSIELVGEDLFLSVRECTAALQVRMRTGCTALLTVGGDEPMFHDSDLQALDILGDTIVVAGEEGFMFRGKLR